MSRVLRRLIWASGTPVFAVMAMTMMWPMNPPLTACSPVDPGHSQESRFQAVDVVIQPWKGRHHVYGLFIIPDRFKYHRLYAVRLRIEGIDAEFSAGSPENEEGDSRVPLPGYFLRRAYLPTRTALWFVITGQFRNLQVPCHWWLVFVERVQ